MTSPAHQAALGFLKGSLIAVVSLALAPPLGAIAGALFISGWPAGMMQFLLPFAGFVFGGAIGGDALGVGPRGAMAFGCGGGAAGLVLLLTVPRLQGLTGFENALAVVSYAMGTSTAAFGATGLIGSLIVGRGSVSRITAGFAAGGAAGGLLGILPFLLLPWTGSWWSDLSMFATLACSIGAIAGPFMVGGIVAAGSWS